jgi:hypothetical protein
MVLRVRSRNSGPLITRPLPLDSRVPIAKMPERESNGSGSKPIGAHSFTVFHNARDAVDRHFRQFRWIDRMTPPEINHLRSPSSGSEGGRCHSIPAQLPLHLSVENCLKPASIPRFPAFARRIPPVSLNSCTHSCGKQRSLV